MVGPMGTSQNCQWPSRSSALLHLVIATLLLLPLGTKAWLLSHHNRLLAWWLKPDLGHSSKLDFPGMWPRNLGLANVFDDSYSTSLHWSTLSPCPLYYVEASLLSACLWLQVLLQSRLSFAFCISFCASICSSFQEQNPIGFC